MKKHNLEISDAELAAFCHRWQITELALFWSVLRDNFNDESDVDFLVTSAPDKRYAAWGYFPEQDEMQSILGRKVDWLTRKSVERGRNPIFRREVLENAETIYAERR